MAAPLENNVHETDSDGMTKREVWIPSDGDGSYDAELIEGCFTKEGRARGRLGHPTWKLYKGQSSINLRWYPERCPKYVYLDDKAAWDVYHSKHYSKIQLRRFWPFDFSTVGNFTFKRSHRGRPVYKGSFSEFESIKVRSLDYWFCGSLPLPRMPPPEKTVKTPSIPEGSADDPGRPAKAGPSSSPLLPSLKAGPKSPEPVKRDKVTEADAEESDSSEVYEKSDTAENAGSNRMARDNTSHPAMSRENTPPLDASHRGTSHHSVESPEQTSHNETGDQDTPGETTSSQDSASDDHGHRAADIGGFSIPKCQKRSADAESLANNGDRTPTPNLKRQRIELVPFTPRQDSLEVENELLKVQVAVAKEELNRARLAVDEKVERKREEAKTFRNLAEALLRSNVDQLDDLARVHSGVKDLHMELDHINHKAEGLLKLMEKLYRRGEETVENQEKVFTDKGMQETWEDFLASASID